MRKLIRIIAEKIVILLGYRSLISPKVEIVRSEIEFEEVGALVCLDDRYIPDVRDYLLSEMRPLLKKYLIIETTKKFDESKQAFINEYQGRLLVGIKRIKGE